MHLLHVLLCSVFLFVEGGLATSDQSWLQFARNHNSFVAIFEKLITKHNDGTFTDAFLLRNSLKYMLDNIRPNDWQNSTDARQRRQFRVMMQDHGYPLIDLELLKAARLLREVVNANASQNATAAQWGPAEWKRQWLEWRKALPNGLSEALQQYISFYRNVQGNDSGLQAVWYRQYENDQMLGLFDRNWALLKPLYRELHAHLRHRLRLKYGVDIVPRNGLIPQHLLDLTLRRLWSNDSVLIEPYPHKRLPDPQSKLRSLFNPFQLIKLGLYDSMTMRYPNESFIEQHIKLKEDSSSNCALEFFDFGRSELYYCPQVTLASFLQSHDYLARLEYALTRQSGGVGLNREACPGFANALGKAVYLSASSPRHMQEPFTLFPDLPYDEERNLNRLYRQAVEMLLTLPTYLVHEHLWIDMLNEEVPPTHYNCRYWQLVQRHMGVSAPADRAKGDGYDMPAQFYEGILNETSNARQMMGELVGYRIYRDICLQAGIYVPGNATKPLNRCWFLSPQSQETLKTMMTAGSQKPWWHILASAGGALNEPYSTAVLQYFEPVYKWLVQDNQRLQLPVSWSVDDGCSRA